MIGRIISTGTRLSEMECNALQSLRTGYQPEQHVFTAKELAHLRFLRWLVTHPVVREGRATTAFLTEFPPLSASPARWSTSRSSSCRRKAPGISLCTSGCCRR